LADKEKRIAQVEGHPLHQLRKGIQELKPNRSATKAY